MNNTGIQNTRLYVITLTSEKKENILKKKEKNRQKPPQSKNGLILFTIRFLLLL